MKEELTGEEFRKMIVDDTEKALTFFKGVKDPEKFIEYWCYGLAPAKSENDVNCSSIFKTWKEDEELNNMLANVDKKVLLTKYNEISSSRIAPSRD